MNNPFVPNNRAKAEPSGFVAIREKLRKIQRLAQSGVAGEKDTAARMLDDLLTRHGLTIDALADEETSMVPFSFSGPADEILLTNVVAFICRTMHVSHRRLSPPGVDPDSRLGKVGVYEYELNPVQAVDVAECLRHYRTRWEEGLPDAMRAFIYKNGVTVPESEMVEPTSPEDLETARRVRAFWSSVSKVDPWIKHSRLE